VALCCDDWIEDSEPPSWLRFAEAAGCGLVMAVSIALLYFGDVLTFPAGALTTPAIVLLISLPTGLTLIIGGYVPHIFRSARRAAMRRRDEAKQLAASAQQLQSEPQIPWPLPDRKNRGGWHRSPEIPAAKAFDKRLASKPKWVSTRRSARGPRPNDGRIASSSVIGKEPSANGSRGGGDPVEAVKGEKVPMA
jgi:hypothetical protein